MSAFARTRRETPESGETAHWRAAFEPRRSPGQPAAVGGHRLSPGIFTKFAASLLLLLAGTPFQAGCAAKDGTQDTLASPNPPANSPAAARAKQPTPALPSPSPAVSREAGLGRVFLAQGRPAVIPLAPPDDVPEAARAAWTPAGPPSVVLENGMELPSRVYRVWGRAMVDDVSPARWLPPKVEWRAVESATGTAPADLPGAFPAGWVALVAAPSGMAERALPKFARVDGRIVELSWLAPAPQNPDIASGAVPQVSPESLRALGEMLRDDATNPQRRWRIRLVAQRMGAKSLWGDRPPPGFGGDKSDLDDPLEAVAEQLELNARSSVDVLRKHDRALALQFLNRLTAVVRTPDGTLLPAWPVGDGRTAEVIISLLSPGPTPEQRIDTARRWLSESAPAQAWMIDDIGTLTRSPFRTEPSVGIADLAGTGGRAWATTSAAFKGEELDVAVPASHAVRLRMTMSADPDASRPMVEAGLTPTGAGDAGWQASISPIVGVAKVTPPGLVLGPALEPWTLESWRARVPTPVTGQREMNVTIQRATPGTDTATASGWEAVVRCSGPSTAKASIDNRKDTIRLWFGPYEHARGVVTITPDRGAEWVRPSDVRAGNDPDARGTRLSGRVTRDPAGATHAWTAVVALPREAFEDDGVTLIIAAERECPAGIRAAFPRPMMPGQAEPGRLAADVSAWGGLPGK